MAEDSFDMVVIGSGPAGEKAAAQAAYFGHRVAIVERARQPGGAAVLDAWVPSKTLREAALYVTGFRRRDIYGVGLDLDLPTALAHLRTRMGEVIETMSTAVAENIRRHNIELVQGSARLAPGRKVVVECSEGGRRVLSARFVLIATGSRPYHPPGIPFDDPAVFDSEEVIAGLAQAFRTIVVVGGGPIACEYASIFSALGLEVTLVDGNPHLLSFMDHEAAGVLADSFRATGMRVLQGAGHPVIARDAGGLKVELNSGEVLRPERVLFGAGRSGNTDELGLEDAGVAVDRRGLVLVDEHFRTTAEGIYAAGDVIGPPALASTAMEQGRVAACHAFGIDFKKAVDSLSPSGVYSIPEAATVGLSEEDVAARGIDYAVGRTPFSRNTRAIVSGLTEGFIKLVFQRADRKLLGVHIVGASATELIHLGQAVLHFGGTIDYFIDTTFDVPTEHEAYKYAAYDGLQALARG